MLQPKLRFPEFNGEWKEKQLKDYLVFQNGLNADKDKFGKGTKFISVLDILNNPFITYDVIRGKVEIDKKTLDNYSVTYGDILFQRSSETREDAGKSNVYLDKENIATFGGFVIRGKKKGEYIPEFMNSLLKSQRVRKEIVCKAQGAQHINVGQETLENVKVIVPTLSEQNKVARFLAEIDEKIEQQKLKIADYEELKKGIMQKIFNQEIRFKDDEGNEFPEWEELYLKECSSYNSSAISAGDVLVKGDYELYDANNKIGYTTCYCSERYISIIKDGAGVGRVRLLPANSFCIGTMGIVKANEKTDIEFLYYLLSVSNFQKFIVGGAIPHIYFKDYGKMKLKIPCLEEQKKIAECLSTLDKKIEAEKTILEDWKQMKNALLQQMFV